MRFFINSYIVALSVTALTLLVAILAAYAFSRFEFPFKRSVNVVIVSVQAVPPITLLIPYFGLIVTLGLYNTYLGLILTHMVFTLPVRDHHDDRRTSTRCPRNWTRPSRSTAPARWTALWRILVPISVPGLVSVGIYTFMIAWNEYLFALTLTRTEDMRTVPIGIQLLMGQHSYEWNQMMAMSILGSHSGARAVPLLPALIHRRPDRRRGQGLTTRRSARQATTQKENTAHADDRQGDLLDVANKHNFAVPAFNISDWAMFNGIVDDQRGEGRAADRRRSTPTRCATSGRT